MFTGIIEETGLVEGIEKKKNLTVLQIKAKKVIKGTKLGDSICVDGVCLTVTSIKKNILSFDVMKESLDVSTLGTFKKNVSVNLERALTAGQRLGGHFVTGHIDFMAQVTGRKVQPNFLSLTIGVPKQFMRYFVDKGSVSVNGVSLTVGKVRGKGFDVYLIPFTGQCTNLGQLKKGDCVNIETDILAKYVINERKRNGT